MPQPAAVTCSTSASIMMEHDLESFEAETADLVRAVAADLERDTAEYAALELTRRLNEARQAHTSQTEEGRRDCGARARHSQSRDISTGCVGAIRFLEEQSGAETNAELRLAIERSDKLRTLRVELTEVTNKLRDGSDGHAVDELRNEVRQPRPRRPRHSGAGQTSRAGQSAPAPSGSLPTARGRPGRLRGGGRRRWRGGRRGRPPGGAGRDARNRPALCAGAHRHTAARLGHRAHRKARQARCSIAPARCSPP